MVMVKKNASWKETSDYIKKARKDPEFMRDLKKFIANSTGKSK